MCLAFEVLPETSLPMLI